MKNKIDLPIHTRINTLTDEFDFEEACSLMNTLVSHINKNPSNLSDIGIVSGILEVNDEIEIVIRYDDYLEQVGKCEYMDCFHEIES